MKELSKDYDRAFLLEETKLTRLIEVMHQRLADQQHTFLRDSFEVYLSGGHREDLPDVKAVLRVDNSRKRPIRRLVIICSAMSADAAAADREVQVDFASPRVVVTSGSTSTKEVVAITVRSDDGAWASSMLSAVEEQVERTWQRYVPGVLGVVALALLITFLIFPFVAPPRVEFATSTMWLKSSDLDRIESLVRDERTITDEEHREIVSRQLRNILAAERPRETPSKQTNRSAVYLAIAAAGIMTCLILVTRTYQRAVFAWNDGATRYAELINRRKILWGIIIGILVVGLLSKFLYEGIAAWLTPFFT